MRSFAPTAASPTYPPTAPSLAAAERSSAFSRLFLKRLAGLCPRSVCVFTYMEQSHNGKSGTGCFSGLGRDSFPPRHVEFWQSLPALVGDGVFFFRINVGTWHPYLIFLYPARSYEDLNDESENDGLHAMEVTARKQSACPTICLCVATIPRLLVIDRAIPKDCLWLQARSAEKRGLTASKGKAPLLKPKPRPKPMPKPKPAGGPPAKPKTYAQQQEEQLRANLSSGLRKPPNELEEESEEEEESSDEERPE